MIEKWNRIRAVRELVNKEIESLREAGQVGSSLQANVELAVPQDTEGALWRRIRGVVPIVGPVILGSLAEVEERTMALEARGFTRPGRRTLLWAPADSTVETVVRWVLVAALVALIAARVTGAWR